MPGPHGTPDLKLRTLESYVERLSAIGADASSDEMPTLAHLINIAKLEAEMQVARARPAAEERKAGPDELWGPV